MSNATTIENLGRELARQIHVLAALMDEKQMAMEHFKLREKTIRKEINRLAMDVSIGQSGLFDEAERG